jgi:hypothetical protein
MIVNKLPYYTYFKNKKYEINTDYRLIINFEINWQETQNKKSVIIKTLQEFYPAFFEIVKDDLLKEAIEFFKWFYLCGEDLKEKENKLQRRKKNIRYYDYNVDAQRIFSAFMQDYKIDLTKKFLHWWKFKAMFDNLSENTKFQKVVGYRCYDGKEPHLKKLKNHYKLPASKEELEIAKQLADSLRRKE